MFEYWSVIGRALIDEGFKEQIFQEVRPREPDTSLMTGLSDFLCRDNKLRLSRWELGDLNRIFGKLKDAESPSSVTGSDPQPLAQPSGSLRDLHVAWHNRVASPFNPSLEMWSLLGLSAIDHEVRRRYSDTVTTTVQKRSDPAAALRQLTDEPPIFSLTSEESLALATFFSLQDAEALLDAIHKVSWIFPDDTLPDDTPLPAFVDPATLNPRRACSGGFVRRPSDGAAPYLHLSPPAVDGIAPSLLAEHREIFT